MYISYFSLLTFILRIYVNRYISNKNVSEMWCPELVRCVQVLRSCSSDLVRVWINIINNINKKYYYSFIILSLQIAIWVQFYPALDDHIRDWYKSKHDMYIHVTRRNTPYMLCLVHIAWCVCTIVTWYFNKKKRMRPLYRMVAL